MLLTYADVFVYDTHDIELVLTSKNRVKTYDEPVF